MGFAPFSHYGLSEEIPIKVLSGNVLILNKIFITIRRPFQTDFVNLKGNVVFSITC